MTLDLTLPPGFGLGWLEASGPYSDIVLSTRVRLARNLQGHAFGPRHRHRDALAVRHRHPSDPALLALHPSR